MARWIAIITAAAGDLGDFELLMFLGFDQHLMELEVGAVPVGFEPERTRIRVIHAMKMRHKYRAALRRATGR